jgi:tetratricopeptide (TPR) repeat protein
MDSGTYDLFLSYVSDDLGIAEKLHGALVEAGFRVWFDRARLSPGCDWRSEIERAAESSRIILPVLTPKWQTSEWCRFETFGGEHVIPVLFRGSWTEVAPPSLRGYQSIDFRQWREESWNTLLHAIRTHLRQPAPNKKSRLSSLPLAHNPCFVGRENELLAIHEQLFRNSATTTLTQGSIIAMTGLGGIGKTTLARAYAEKFWRLYQDVLWVSAEPELLTLAFARLAVELGLVSEPSPNIGRDAQRALQELNGRTPHLLIVDNAPDERSVQYWLPTAGSCHTIVTSRFAEWSPAVSSIPLNVLPPSPARALLLLRSGIKPDDRNSKDADLVASELGYLPLALEQAAAFARKSALSFYEYLELYAHSRRTLLDQGSLGGTRYPDSVITTWKATMSRMGMRARRLFQLCAFLAPDNIPIEVLENADALLDYDAVPRMGRTIHRFFNGSTPSEKTIVKESRPRKRLSTHLVLAELAEYSMVSVQKDGIVLHRLVQAVQMDSLSPRNRKKWAKRAVIVVNESLPYIEGANLASYWQLYSRILPHALSAAELIAEWEFSFPDAWRLLNQVGCYLMDQGEYAQAERYHLLALRVRSDLGEKHPDFASTADSLSVLYQRLGRFELAQEFQSRALELRREIFGEHHPTFAESLNNLAVLQDSRGDYGAAELLYRQALDIYRTYFGQNNARYAQIVNNLAVFLYRIGNYLAAEPLYQETLRIRKNLLGDQDPEVAYVLANLATLYRAMGRYTEAESLYQQALEIRQNSIGPSHPEFGRNMSDLARLYDLMGDPIRAEPLYRRSLEIIRKSFGSGHPLLVKVLDNFASSLRCMNRLIEASEIQGEVEYIRKQQVLDENIREQGEAR